MTNTSVQGEASSEALRRPRLASAVAWWALTILSLVILDDLTSGPFFWVLSRLSAVLAICIAFAVYFLAQVALVRAATNETQGKVAGYFLNRLNLERRHDAVAERERSLRARVTGPLMAVPLSLVVGGVIPALVLYRNGASRTSVRRLSVVTAATYAAEFTLLHAYLPSTI